MTSKTNFYRGLLACACVQALCSTANAGITSDWKPYVGAGAGYSVVDVKGDRTEYSAGGDTAFSSSSSTAKGAVESLFIGAQKQINNMAFGGELYGYLSQQKTKTSSGTTAKDFRRESIQRQYGYGVKIKTGYFINPTALAYVHVGIERARFKYAGTVDLLNPATGKQSFKKNKSLIGVPLGAGFEVDISPVWKTRFEYTYTKYKTWKTGDVLTSADVATAKLSPRQHTVVLGFSYQI